jgi:putative peptidoglycan lipid II flippase
MSLIGVIAAPVLIWLFAPGFGADPVRFDLAATMLRITFPYLLLISITAFFGAILNAHGRFGVPAFSPVFLNVAMIVCAYGLQRYFEVPEMALAWGVFVGGVLQLICHIPALMRINRMPRFKPNFSDPRVKRLLRLMLPALFGVSVVQINLLMDTIFVSILPVGSVTWLYYADRVMEFPLGIFGVALATTVLPHLSRSKANNQHDHYGSTLDWAMRMVLLVGAPAAIGLGVMAGPLISTLFQHGEFVARDVIETTPALQAYAFGLFWFILVKILASGYYACQDLRTPVKYGIVALLVNFSLNVLLVRHFHQAGLAFSTGVAAFVNCALLFFGLKRLKLLVWQPGWTAYLIQFGMALLCMTLYLLLATPDTASWIHLSSAERGSQLMMSISVAMAIYFGTLWVTGLRPAHLRSPSLNIS